MILEEETFREFGYYPGDWAPKSAKKILAACDDCGKVRITSKHAYRALCRSCSLRGRHPSEETREKLREALKGNKRAFGNRHSEETRSKMSESTKKNWQDPDFIKKVFDGLNAKPNGLEKKVGEILQKHLPDEYAYNGDFSCGITIGGKIPDFVNVNGEKIVIEVFGPWHDEVFLRERFDKDISWKRTEFGTKAHYSQFGYKCVVFWQEDLEREDVEKFVLSVLRENKIL